MVSTQPWRAFDLEADTRIRDWIVGPHLAEGGSSSIYAAEYAGLSTRFPPRAALKIVSDLGPSRTEATIAAYNRKPHGAEIGEVYDLFETEANGRASLVFVLELADHSLADVLRERVLTETEVDGLAHSALGGLQAYHAAGLVHGDIKPSNILWCDGEWKLGDHGASAPISGNGTTDAVLHESSLEYRPPETFEDPGTGHRHHDLWALAITLNEAASGRRPHLSRHDQIAGVFDVAPQLSPTIAAFVSRVLDPEPRNRPRHAGEVDLGDGFSATEFEATTDWRPSITPEPTGQRKHSRWILITVGAAIVLGTAVLGVVSTSNRSDTPTTPTAPTTPTTQKTARAAPASLVVTTTHARPTSQTATTAQATTTALATTTSTRLDDTTTAPMPEGEVAPPSSNSPSATTTPAAPPTQAAPTAPVLVLPVEVTPNSKPAFLWQKADGAISYNIFVNRYVPGVAGSDGNGIVNQFLTPLEASCVHSAVCVFVSPVALDPVFEWWVIAHFADSDKLFSDGNLVRVEPASPEAGAS